MLVLSRKVGEKVVIGGNITVTITRVAGHRVTLGIEAPDAVRVVRGELATTVQEASPPADPVVEVSPPPLADSAPAPSSLASDDSTLHSTAASWSMTASDWSSTG